MKRGQTALDVLADRYWLTEAGWLATGGVPQRDDEDES